MQLIKVAHLILIFAFGGLTIIHETFFKAATGDSEWTYLVSFDTLKRFSLSSLYSSNCVMITDIFWFMSLNSLLFMNSELFSNFIMTSEVGIATTTPVKNAEIICTCKSYLGF